MMIILIHLMMIASLTGITINGKGRYMLGERWKGYAEMIIGAQNRV